MRITELLTGDDLNDRGITLELNGCDLARRQSESDWPCCQHRPGATVPTADSLVSPHLTPLSIDEPPRLSSGGDHRCRDRFRRRIRRHPLAAAASAGHRVQPPVNFRLASAEEAIPRPEAESPLKLTPRTPANRSERKGIAKASGHVADPGDRHDRRQLGYRAWFDSGHCLVLAALHAGRGAAPLPKKPLSYWVVHPYARQQMQLAPDWQQASTGSDLARGSRNAHRNHRADRGRASRRFVPACTRPGSSSAAFRQTLTQLANEPSQAGFVGHPRTTSRGAR